MKFLKIIEERLIYLILKLNYIFFLKETLVNNDEVGNDLEHVQQLQKKYEEFQKELSSHEEHMIELNRRGDELIDSFSNSNINVSSSPYPVGGSGLSTDTGVIRGKQKELNEAWSRLRKLASQRQERLFGAHEIQRLNRDIEEAMAWMSEKEACMDSLLTNSGSSGSSSSGSATSSSGSSSNDQENIDLASVQAMQRKHDALDRDLFALGDKVKSLRQEAERLLNNHNNNSSDNNASSNANQLKQLNDKLNELNEKWSRLEQKSDEKRKRLIDSIKLQRLLSDWRDLVTWLSEMTNVMSGEEMAKDVSGAEALIERHGEYKAEIETHEESFDQWHQQALTLISQSHFASSDIELKSKELRERRDALLLLWNTKNELLSQCYEVQLFMRDCDQADTWLLKQENLLSSNSSNSSNIRIVAESLDDVEALLKKHDDFEKSLQAQEDKARLLDEFGERLSSNENCYAREQVDERRMRLRERRERIIENARQRRIELESALKYFSFERECDELNAWMREKLKIAQADDYLDTAGNLQAKQQKHVTFETELSSHQSRVEQLCSHGQQLANELATPELAGLSYFNDRINQHISQMMQLWDQLVDASEKKHPARHHRKRSHTSASRHL